MIDVQALEIGGDPPLADALGDRAALGLQFAMREIVEQGRAREYRRCAMAMSGLRSRKRLGDPGERPAGADRADETVDLAIASAPRSPARWCGHGRRDWRHCRTGWRRSRHWDCRAPSARPAAPPIFHVIVGVVVRHRRHLDQFGAEHPERILLLLGLGLGDDDHRLHAERIADHGQADAGIARGAVDDRPAGAKLAALDRVLTMASAARSLTDSPGFMNSALPRIVQPVSSRRALQFDQRRIADRGEDIVGHDPPSRVAHRPAKGA